MTRPTEIELDKLERHAHLAREWLLWSFRRNEMNRRLAASTIFANGLFPADDFLDHVCARNRDRYRDDVQWRIEAFIGAMADAVRRGCAALPLLHILALRGDRISITFDSGRPQLRGDRAAYNPGPNRLRRQMGSVSRWQHYASDFDPDAIATLEYARHLNAMGWDGPNGKDFETWPLHMSFADEDLERLIAQGTSDQHIHMKSVAAVAISWQRTLANERRLKQASVFKPREIGGERRLNAELSADYDYILDAILTARGGFKAAGNDHAPGLLGAVADKSIERFFERKEHGDPETFSGTNELHPRSPRVILRPYRHALTQIWQLLLGAPSAQRDSWEALFDQYLTAKMRFRYHHLQHTYDTNPGLSTFDLFRKRNSHLGRFHEEEASGSSFNLRRFAVNNGLLVSTLVDDETIQRADLRIAPQTVVPNALARTYARHGFGLAQLYYPHQGRVDLGTSIHFKRHLARRKADRDFELPNTGPLLRKIEEYDRETAGLQQMRSRLAETPEHTATSERTRMRAALDVYRRIDLASLERGSGPERIAPFVRLLRGDVETLEALEKLPQETPYALRWRRLCTHGRASPPVNAPQLDLTVHAGEDFDTLVQGLYHIERAVETWRMRPGDSLGHALALGPAHLTEAHYHRNLDHKQITLGNDLDQLAWLLDIVDRELPGHAWLGQRLRDAIRQIALKLYAPFHKAFAFNPVDVDLIKEKALRTDRFLPLPSEFGPLRLREMENSTRIIEDLVSAAGDLPALKPADILRVADLFVPDIANPRMELKRPNPVHHQLRDTLKELQNWVTELVVSRGLTIETNPSSNLRMGRHEDVRDLPLVPLMKRTDGPRITVCTDNPGTYDVSVSSEYAMLFEALRAGEDGLSREAALARLDDMRRIGLGRIAWRKPAKRRSGRAPEDDSV